MPFGYSRKVFSHPAIEYIPILPMFSEQIVHSLPMDKPQILLVKGNENFSLLPFSNQLNYSQIIPDKEMGLLLLNAQSETIKYRGNYVTIVATTTPAKHQLIKIVTRYFYKSDLVFQLIDRQGKVSSQKVLSIPITR